MSVRAYALNSLCIFGRTQCSWSSLANSISTFPTCKITKVLSTINALPPLFKERSFLASHPLTKTPDNIPCQQATKTSIITQSFRQSLLTYPFNKVLAASSVICLSMLPSPGIYWLITHFRAILTIYLLTISTHLPLSVLLLCKWQSRLQRPSSC